MALSVIVPVYNGAATLAEQLTSLVEQSTAYEWELVIVDNASTDGTAQIAAEYAANAPFVRVVDALDGHNLSYVRNVGVAQSFGRSVAFCDADDVVGPGWVNAIATALDHQLLVGSRLEYDRLNEMAGAGASRFASDGLPTMFGYPVVTGAGLGCQRSLWDALGGNDESWDSTGEDFEFAMRAARDFDVRPFFVEGAVYHYRLRQNARAMFRQNRRYGRSHARLFKEFGSDAFRTPVLPTLKSYVALVANVSDLRDPQKSKAWARAAGKRLGRLEGSVIYRTLYL